MARLFPKIEPAEIENSGERKVATALVSQLPPEVEVFHSFHWMSNKNDGTVEQGECDFVVVDPNNGVIFVEVKGGTLEYDSRRDEWIRVHSADSHEVLKKDPFAQARSSMYDIIERIGSKFAGGSDNLPFTYGYAVAFPDFRYSGSLPASIMPDLVLDALKCRDIAQSIERIFERFRKSAHRPLSSRDIQSIHESLLPHFALVPVIWRKVEDQEERLHRLTADQQNLLRFMGQQSCAAIEGVAGSGKTILALAKAQECVRAGLRTLFLCYNRPLADWLAQAVPEEGHLVIKNYHGLVDSFCRAANMPIWEGADIEDANFWNNQAPENLMAACGILGDDYKFDALIVDEGQDFRELWWTSLDEVFRDASAKACYYVFYDPYQNIYVKNPVLPEEFGKPFLLPINCRNTVKIAEHCASIVGRTGEARSGAPVGDDPEVKNARSVADGFKKAGKQVRAWCTSNAGGLKSSQVVVLAPRSTKSHWPKDFLSVPTTTDFDEWRANKGVLISTWGRFKGLEADAVVILEPQSSAIEIDDSSRYVARSRAKHLLLIIEVHDGPEA